MTIFVATVKNHLITIKQKIIFRQKYFWMNHIQKIFQLHFAVTIAIKIFQQMRNIFPVLLNT